MSNNLKPATTYPAIVGRILEQKRATLALSQGALAAKIGLSQGAWSRIEHGSSTISLDQLRAVAAVLETTPAAVLDLADRAEHQLQGQGVKIVPPRSTGSNAAMMTGAALGALLAIILLKKA